MQMILYHTVDFGTNKTAATIAIDKAVALSKQSGHTTIRIAVHTRNSFRAGVFRQIFSAAAMIAITGGYGWPFKGVTVFLMTELEECEAPNDSPVIAVHVQRTWIDVLVSENTSRAIIFLPWSSDELRMHLLQHPESQLLA